MIYRSMTKPMTLAMLTVLLLGLALAQDARATALEVSGGFTLVEPPEYNQVGAKLIFFEGKRSDFYIGLDVTTMDYEDNTGSDSAVIELEAKQRTIMLGWRYKYFVGSRYQSYFFLGAGYSTIDISQIGADDPAVTVIGATSATESDFAYAVGVGGEMALTESLGLGLEAGITKGLAKRDVVYEIGATRWITSVGGDPLIGVALKLKYSF